MPLRARPSIVWRLFVVGTIAVFVLYFALAPLYAGDTDTWYHLAAGRRILSEGIPKDAYFSFLEPKRGYVDYYWLFQVIAFGAFSLAGYHGLIALRALLFAGLLFVVSRFFDERARRGHVASASLLFALYPLLFEHRERLLRPHTFTFLLFATILFVLERRPRWTPVVPLLATVWVNAHGVTYPWLLILCAAYAADLVVERVRTGRPLQAGGLVRAISLALSGLAVLATPHGLSLLRVPFAYSRHSREYIGELARPELSSFFSFEVHDLVPSYGAIVLVLGGLALAHALRLLPGGRLRVSQIILLSAGFAFLVDARRFCFEFAIVCLPLASSYAWRSARSSRFTSFAAPLAALAVFVAFVANARPHLPKAPFTASALPVGSATFLRTVGGGGAVLNHPNDGGYLAWELYPRYRLYMDMEVPFLFRDEDLFLYRSAAEDPNVLGALLARYRPPYVLARSDKVAMGQGLARAGYRPVYFDDVDVLYASRALVPEVVEKYELVAIDPWVDLAQPFALVAARTDRARVVAELGRMLTIWPGGREVHRLMAEASLEARDLDSALRYATRLTEDYPDEAAGHALSGGVLAARGDLAASIRSYERALTRASDDAAKAPLHRAIGRAHARLERYDAAYEHFSKGTPLFDGRSSAADLYELAGLAVLAGRADDARLAVQFAEAKLGPGDDALRKRIENGMRQAGIAPLSGKAQPVVDADAGAPP